MESGFKQMKDIIKPIKCHYPDCECSGCRLKIIQNGDEIKAIANLIEAKDREILRLKRSSAIFCLHANEVPNKCLCGNGCYCKENTCRTTKQRRNKMNNNCYLAGPPKKKTVNKVKSEYISALKAYILMKKSAGLIFTVQFVKKDGSIRTMNCRLGVRQGITGRGMSYNPEDKEMLCVYDVKSQGYRTINLDSLLTLKINKKSYKIKK